MGKKNKLLRDAFVIGYCDTSDPSNECSVLMSEMARTINQLNGYISRCRMLSSEFDMADKDIAKSFAKGEISAMASYWMRGELVYKHRENLRDAIDPLPERGNHYVRWILEQSSNEQEIS